MKSTKSFIALAALVFAAATAFGATGTSQTATNAVAPRSTFELPATVKDGRDPFFPESTRMSEVAASAAASTSRPSTDVTSLKVPGISGTPGNMFAIINNHTFAVGDEGDVLTPNGRVHLRCLEIHPDAVVVLIAGRIHRIKLESE